MSSWSLKKADIAVIAAILSAALIGQAVLAWRDKGDAAGLSAEIYLDGALTRTAALAGGEQRIRLESGAGYNVLLAGPQGIMMLEADCRNQDCVHCGLVSRPGGVIACLPHRLLVRLSGGKDGAFDAVTR